MFLIVISLAYAIPANAVLGISISTNGGVNYSNMINNTWLASTPGDVTKSYGNETEMWGITSFSMANVSNGNLTFRLNMTSATGISFNWERGSGVDYVSLTVYYSLPSLNLSFINWTPPNNSIIGSTIRVNVSSAVTNLTSCILETNRTGTATNTTLIIGTNDLAENLNYCYGHLYKTVNRTHFYYKVYINGSGSSDTILNKATVNTTAPNITSINMPVNNSNIYNTSYDFILNVTDKEGDFFDFNFSIHQLNGSTMTYLVTNITNITYVHTLTSPLLNGLAFWNASADDSNTTSRNNNNFGICRCDDIDCQIKCYLNCSFPNVINVTPISLVLNSTGTCTFNQNATGIYNYSVTNSCLLSFMNGTYGN